MAIAGRSWSLQGAVPTIVLWENNSACAAGRVEKIRPEKAGAGTKVEDYQRVRSSGEKLGVRQHERKRWLLRTRPLGTPLNAPKAASLSKWHARGPSLTCSMPGIHCLDGHVRITIYSD